MASKDLGAQLKDADIEFDENILTDLNLLVHDLNLRTDDFVNEWLAYQHNHNALSIDQSSFKRFSKHLRVSKSGKICKKTRSRSHNTSNVIHNNTSLAPLMEMKSTPNTNNYKRKAPNDALMTKYLAMTTPNKISNVITHKNMPINTPNIHQSPLPINHTAKSRKKRGERIDVLNENITKNNNIKHIDIDIKHCNKEYRFMNENVYWKENAIKGRISFIGKYLMQQIDEDIVYHGIDEASQRSCYYLGRIMNDGDNYYGSDKITEGNIVLMDEDGKSIKLDISSLESVSLFPGQIVAVKGVNSSGKEINVERIHQNAYIKHKEKKEKIAPDNDGVLQIMIGCGPFTAQNSLEFNGSPFHDFAKIVLKNGANIVILMGPFTDSQNELIKKNEINCTFHELFQHLLSSFIAFIGNNISVIITSSTKDIHHFTAFPQQKYIMQSVPENVYFIGNPSSFCVNNVSFGVCSADFIWDCCKIGFTKNIKDRLLSIITHCIDQQNFYPLQPPSSSLRMDYNNHEQLYIEKKLDLLIMPSNLKQFAKIYKDTNTICINPSYLTRLNSGGSYAVLNIHQSNDNNVTDYSNLVRVDILRI